MSLRAHRPAPGLSPSSVSPSFRDQLERAALSVSNNIAEGFERGTTNELLMFIYIARGSAGEVRSMFGLLSRRAAIPKNLQSETSEITAIAESCSRQLRAWADSLQNSDIEGPRHLNEKSRADYEKRTTRDQGAEAFRKMLLENVPPGHPARPKC